jgi:uncharacterized protein (DUF362 family)
LPQPYPYATSRSTVALVHGDNRRKNIHDALLAIDEQIKPNLKRKKYVVIKVNGVSGERQIACTHADAMHGVLDYLGPRFNGPVVIAESSAGETWEAYEAFGYRKVADEHRSQKVSLVDLNEEARYEVVSVLDYDLHVIPLRLAARLLDPDAYVICCAVMKTHNVAVATLSVKNMVLGGALHQAPKETPRWSDKRKYHVGIRQFQVNIMLTAQKLRPNWGVTVLDGFEGMGAGWPYPALPVDQRIAIASTDYIAADRVAVEAMGINSDWVGHLIYCYQAGLGQYDLDKIDVRGAKIADVRQEYPLHPDTERELQWMGPMNELPPSLGLQIRDEAVRAC